jgi:hypothetical protein
LLGQAWKRWRAIAQVIGDFQARILLTVFYFIIVTPGALIVRAFFDPLQIKRSHGASMWTPHTTTQPSLDDARRQY